MILFRYIDIFRCWLVLGRPRWRKWPSRKSDRNSRLVRIYLPYFPWKLFFFKIFKTLKISYSFRIKFSLICNENLNSFLIRVRKLFKGGNYLREENIRGNTIPTSIWQDFHLSSETEVTDIFFIFRSSSSPRSAAYIMWDTGQGK